MSKSVRVRSAEELALYLDAAGLGGYVREYRFHPKRRWRFDFAWVEAKVALEFNGGVFKYGRHNRALGYLGDLEKLNTAQSLGWRVFQYAPTMDLAPIVSYIQSLIGK